MQRCCQSTASGFYKRHLGETLLIYLDANIVQYCADYEDFIFGDSTTAPVGDDRLLKELEALRELVELEQLGEGWDVAAPAHLMKEVLSGKPTPNQRKVYAILLQAWQDSEWKEFVETNEEKILLIERSLRPLNFKDATDRWHLAEAIALGASWFLTNDKNIIRRTRQKPEFIKVCSQSVSAVCREFVSHDRRNALKIYLLACSCGKFGPPANSACAGRSGALCQPPPHLLTFPYID